MIRRRPGATLFPYTTLFRSMGKDGAQGLLEMRQAGGWTMAQDKESSIVYGMPFEAAQRGAARKILALDEMAPALDRKSTRLNSSHGYISYAVFCLKKKKK